MPQTLDAVEDRDVVLVLLDLFRISLFLVDGLLELVQGGSDGSSVCSRGLQTDVACFLFCDLKIVENVRSLRNQAPYDGIAKHESLRRMDDIHFGCVCVLCWSVSRCAEDRLEAVKRENFIVYKFAGEASRSAKLVGNLEVEKCSWS